MATEPLDPTPALQRSAARRPGFGLIFGVDGQALGRSRGGFSTKIHLKSDLDGLPIGFHLTGGEASDSRQSKSSSTSAPTSRRARR